MQRRNVNRLSLSTAYNHGRRSTSFDWPRMAPQIDLSRLQTLVMGDNHVALESFCAKSFGTTYNYMNIGPLVDGVEHLGNYVLDIPGCYQPGYACFGFRSVAATQRLAELELQGHAERLFVGLGDAERGVYRWSGPLSFGRASAAQGCQGSLILPLPAVLSRGDAGRSFLTFALPLGSYAQLSSIRVHLGQW